MRATPAVITGVVTDRIRELSAPEYTSFAFWLSITTQSPGAGMVDIGLLSTSNSVTGWVISSGALAPLTVSAALR
ncbi:hypothetical protein GALL_524520 [mine drainage metagenome]|uniref:Uncharacterized protein n=1 Tax=mine drainage metagenome TaxID=410659 RepID=A0A1J5P4D8_9ZZZZ